MVDTPPSETTKDKIVNITTKALENLPFGFGTVASFAQAFLPPHTKNVYIIGLYIYAMQ